MSGRSGPFAPVLAGARGRARAVLVGLGIVAAALGVAAPSALAARPATADETAAIAVAVGLPASCVSAQISTAVAGWATAVDTNVAPCSQADGTVVLQLVSGVWKNVTSGSDFGFCPIIGVPDAVSTEFSLCTPVTPASYVLGSASVVPEHSKGFGERKPRTIDDGLGALDVITGVNWKGWGSSTATATATGRIGVQGKDARGRPKVIVTKVRIQLRASKQGRCDDIPAYMRLEERAPKKHGGPLGPWTAVYGIKDLCAPAG